MRILTSLELKLNETTKAQLELSTKLTKLSKLYEIGQDELNSEFECLNKLLFQIKTRMVNEITQDYSEKKKCLEVSIFYKCYLLLKLYKLFFSKKEINNF